MQTFEIILSIVSVTVAVASIWYTIRIVKTSGRDRPRDPERVQRFVDAMTAHTPINSSEPLPKVPE